MVTQGFYPADLIDSRTANIDTWTNFDAATAFDVNAKLLVATTDDDPSSGSATFTSFQPFANGTYVARGFKFRAELTTNDPAQSIEIDQLGYTAELERRTETVNSLIASGTSSKSVTFTHTFFTGTSDLGGSTTAYLPTIGIVIENAQSGDFFTLSSVTGSGFSIDIKNGSSFVDRNFKYTAVGFGRGS